MYTVLWKQQVSLIFSRQYQIFSLCEPAKITMRTVWTGAKKLCEPVRTGAKIYANGCEPKAYPCECHLKKYVNRVNRRKILCETVWTGAENNANRCEPWFALTESLDDTRYQCYHYHKWTAQRAGYFLMFFSKGISFRTHKWTREVWHPPGGDSI